MATLLQVLQTLTSQVTSACYPNGTSSPSVTGKQITLESGFPIRSQQDLDLSDGFSHVYVYPTDKERNVTKFQRIFQPLVKSSATLTANISGNEITIGGTVSLPQAIMIFVDNDSYAYQVLSGDTLNSIAASLAALIPGASSLANVITVPNSYNLMSRIATNYSAGEELSRVDRVFNIYVVSPDFTDRSTIIDAIDVKLKLNYRMALPDDFTAMVFYNNTIIHDELEQYTVFKGWLGYTIQYPTTLVQNYTTITNPFAITSVAANL